MDLTQVNVTEEILKSWRNLFIKGRKKEQGVRHRYH